MGDGELKVGMGWMVIKGQRSSKSTFGANKTSTKDLYIIGRFCLSVTFLLIYGSRSVFMGIHGSRLVIHSSQSVFMVFIGSRLVFHVSRLVVHGFS